MGYLTASEKFQIRLTSIPSCGLDSSVFSFNLRLSHIVIMLADAHSNVLSRALVQGGPFHCEGTLQFPAEQLQLFYRTGSDARYLVSNFPLLDAY